MHNLNSGDRGTTQTALIVDFESRTLYEISKAFREAGYRTVGATAYAEAKKVIIAERPHVMISDVRLGEFNGIQLLVLAREVQPAMTVVITSTFVDAVLADETRRLGGIFMVKPIDSRDLIATVRERSQLIAPIERRRKNRRVLITATIAPERRLGERRDAIGADQRSTDRRVMITNFEGDRPRSDRRRST